MSVLKIKFVDFWHGFIEDNNFLYNVLSKYYSIEISENPDILFFSCYGSNYLKYKCIRIFYTAENMRCDFTSCDFAMTFDFLSDSRHYRLPLYAFYIEQQNFWNHLTANKSFEDAKSEWLKKSKFCCMVVSNGNAQERIDFFKKLSNVAQIDSGGRYLNNIGGPVDNKLKFIKDYKFVISYENSSYPGYTTEKILEPLMTNSIPIYWGNPYINKDFNPLRFINRADFTSDEDLINYILYLNENPNECIKILLQPIFKDNQIPPYIQEQNLIAFINSIIEKINTINPVALRYLRYVHEWKRKKKTINYYFNRVFRIYFKYSSTTQDL